jgi:membrane-associated protease RseP (regulator of RpoE activity)
MHRQRWVFGLAASFLFTFAVQPLPAQVAPRAEDVPAPKPEAPAPPAGAMLGIRATDVTESAARAFRLNVRKGALISALLRGSPAERAGLPLGGVIVAVDGVLIESPEDLVRTIRSARPGQRVELKYYESDRMYRKSIELVPYSVPFVGNRRLSERLPEQSSARRDEELPDAPPSNAELNERIADLQGQIDQLRDEIKQLKRTLVEFVERQKAQRE